MIFWSIVIPLLSIEVFLWGCALNRHARMMKELGDKDCLPADHDVCFKRNWIRVFMASVMATALSMGVGLWWLVVWLSGAAETFVYPQWIAAGLQLSHIHLFAILARCTCLDKEDWPKLSQLKSAALHRLGFFGAEDG